ncbi:MAG: hypothetical protein KDD33_07720 [Bdellovibrionales bacterium]|nr:hypothetical protein [Bdellovibrionales bacterium]
MKLVFLVFAILVGLPVAIAQVTAVAPIYRSTEAITTMLADKDVIKKLGVSSTIYSIDKSKSGYVINIGECYLPVEVKRILPPAGMPGKATIQVKAFELNCPDDDSKTAEAAQRELCSVAAAELPTLTYQQCIDETQVELSSSGQYQIEVLICGDDQQLYTFVQEEDGIFYGSQGAGDSCE